MPKRRRFSRCSNSWVRAESASKRTQGEIAFSKTRSQRLKSVAREGTFRMRNRLPFPFFLTSVGSNSAPSMMIGSRAAPKSLLSAISFSKSRRISCLEGGTRMDFSAARFSSLITRDECSPLALECRDRLRGTRYQELYERFSSGAFSPQPPRRHRRLREAGEAGIHDLQEHPGRGFRRAGHPRQPQGRDDTRIAFCQIGGR